MKTKVKIEITFEDYSDYKMHLALINKSVKHVLDHPELQSEGDVVGDNISTAYSSHKFSVEKQEE